jgi:ribosomal-protein-alanine N-acetyltransferase
MPRWLARFESWPVELSGHTPSGEPLLLRALQVKDRAEFQAVRRANREWLAPWDATSPDEAPTSVTFRDLVRNYDRDAKAGRSLPFVVEFEGRIVGQMNLSSITYGSFRSCSAGYWVSRSVAGRGITPTALALAGDYALGSLGLHRIEVNIRPENTPSLAVVRKLAFREEGSRLRMLHIDGAWRDHLSFALTTEDLAGGTLTERLKQREQHRQQESHWRHTEAGPL